MTVLSRLSALKPFCVINQRATIIIRNFTQLKPHGVKNIPKYTRSFYKLFKKQTAETFKLKDNMPQPYQLIYRNTMENYLILSQIFSTICLFMLGVVIVAGTTIEENQVTINTWAQNPKPVENEMYIYITCLAGMCVILQFLLKKMPVRVYNWPQQDKYVFVYYKSVPFLTRRVTCLQKEISKSPESGILPWKSHKYDVKDSSGIILLENFFRNPADLNIMLGYQKHSV